MARYMSTFIVSRVPFFFYLNQIHYFGDNCCVLADGEGCLSWTRRMNIILGMARGLKYLHSELQPPFTISELNSGAVYLTDDFSPKVLPVYKLLKYVPCYFTILQTISYNPWILMRGFLASTAAGWLWKLEDHSFKVWKELRLHWKPSHSMYSSKFAWTTSSRHRK